ncbi:MAG: hypothetical protein ABEI97_01905 [Candidatus Nanohaloarchaea archaeon]
MSTGTDPYPHVIGVGLHTTAVAGSSPSITGDVGENPALGLYEDVVGRGNRLYPTQEVYVWTDGYNERDALPMEIIPLHPDDLAAELTADEIDEFLKGKAVVPGPAHTDTYDWRQIDDRIVHDNVQDEGLFEAEATLYLRDPTSNMVTDRLQS